jgi:hypothetical protein
MKKQRGIRGMGHVFQPKYRNKKTGEVKRVSRWFIKYYVNGRAHTETSGSTNRNVAERLLKKRHGDAQAGKAVGAQVERTVLNDLLNMVISDYAANARKSGDRIPVRRRAPARFLRRRLQGERDHERPDHRLPRTPARRGRGTRDRELRAEPT